MSTSYIVSSDPHGDPGQQTTPPGSLQTGNVSRSPGQRAVDDKSRQGPIRFFLLPEKWRTECSGNVAFPDPLEPVAHSFDNVLLTAGIRCICARVFRRDSSFRTSREKGPRDRSHILIANCCKSPGERLFVSWGHMHPGRWTQGTSRSGAEPFAIHGERRVIPSTARNIFFRRRFHWTGQNREYTPRVT